MSIGDPYTNPYAEMVSKQTRMEMELQKQMYDAGMKMEIERQKQIAASLDYLKRAWMSWPKTRVHPVRVSLPSPPRDWSHLYKRERFLALAARKAEELMA